MDKPIHASHHCRHYSYEGGPRCACGIDNSLANTACMPVPFPETRRFEPCSWREEYTFDERIAWGQWKAERFSRMIAVMAEIPGSFDKKESWGKTGDFPCPACLTGKVLWTRARVNGHVHAYCTTPNCFQVMQ